MLRITLYLILFGFNLFSGQNILAQATVFLRTGGDITTPGDWGTSADGLSGTLSDFSQNNTYNFTSNNASRALSAAWNITSGSTVVLGDGLTGFTLTYSGSATMGSTPANVIMNNLSRLVFNTNYNLDASKTTFNSGSTIEYALGTSSVAGDDYQNLVIANNVSTNGSTLTTNGILNILSSAILSFNNTSSLTIAGSTVMDGTISSDNTGTLAIVGNGNPLLIFTSGFETVANLFINATCSFGPVIVSSSFTFSYGILSFGYLELNGPIFFQTNTSAVLRGSQNATLTIGGSGTITNDLLMDNTNQSTQSLKDLNMNRSGASLGISSLIPVRIWGSVNPTSGTITTNSNLFLQRDATRKARIGPVGASGAINGNITLEVERPAGATGWVNLCSAGIIGKTMADWNTSFAITCPICPDGNVVNNATFTSIYSYNEAAPTATSASDPLHYVGLNNITDPIDLKTGYWVYLGNAYPNSSAITIPLTGAVNTKTASGNFLLTLTGAASTETGWNLIANPYPSPIQVSQFIASAGGANIDNTLLVYDPDTDSNVPLTAGAVIPMGQAFMVRALVNNTSVTPDESWKTATADNTSLQKQIAGNSPVGNNGRPYYFNEFLIDLQSTDVPKNFFTQAYFSFGTGGTTGFDNGKDAYSIESSVDPGTPRLFSLTNNESFLRNALPSIYGTLSIPLKVVTGYPGNYTLNPINLNKLPSGACVVLYDLINNVHHDLRTGPYTTSLNVSTAQTTPQFELIITSLPATLSASQKDPLCNHSQDAYLVAKGSSTGPWNYSWKDENNTLLQYKASQAGADTLDLIGQGVYKVEVNPVGTCKTAVKEFTLQAITPLPLANFSANTTSVSAQSNVPISFTNLSQNASEFTWEFGNGMSVSSLHTNYTFNTPGLYTVKLTAGNGICQDYDQKSMQVQVLDMPVGIGQHEFMSEELVLVQEGNSIYILVNSSEKQNFTLSAYNALGQNLIKEKIVQPVNGRIDIQIPTSENLLFVKLSNENKSKTFKVVH